MRCTGSLFFVALLSFAAALNCEVDLSLIPSSETEPGIAQCDAGCNDCSFYLYNGGYEWGTVECLSNVECFVKVSSLKLDRYSMQWTTIDGSQASELTVVTQNATYNVWYDAVFHAPANRGDFRFEISDCYYAMSNTDFHAVNSGVVDIVIHSDGLISNWVPEVKSLNVYASTAEELSVWMKPETCFALFQDSTIECPTEGKCQWKADGEPVDGYDDENAMVNLYSAPGTDLRVLCAYKRTCERLTVHCYDSAESCEMEVVTSDNCNWQTDCDWQCEGSLDLAIGCKVITTTTATPTSTTETPTTTITTTTQKSDGGNGWHMDIMRIIEYSGFAFIILVLCGGLYHCQKELRSEPRHGI